MFRIGTLADWFGVGLREGIRQSQRVGAEGVQVYAWNELNPLTVTTGELNELKRLAVDCGQKVTALCGELGGHGLEIQEDNAWRVAYLKKTIDCALTLDCNVVTTHIGCIPEDKNLPKYRAMLEACGEVASYAAERGAWLAVETGPEPVARLVDFIGACPKGLAVNYDPANLVMVTGDDEVQGVYTAGKLIVHTHAKDGKCNKRVGAEVFYGVFADGGVEALREADMATEYPLGQGDVRWEAYLNALRDVGYDGFLTIEREVGENAGADIALAVGFLQEAIAGM
ncbi:MAG: sugar phosphate isomerase/epimerase [Lachnospiraceae bacterium]|jgi:sugar phosphate isomerase/epimerase|nr:sugar phosphate isomerase/epimerase [Lachnospiraceae bacterium]